MMPNTYMPNICQISGEEGDAHLAMHVKKYFKKIKI